MSASCAAFSSTARRASSTSRFFCSTARVLLDEQRRLLLQLLVDLLQLLLLLAQHLLGRRSVCACFSSSGFERLSSFCCRCSSLDCSCSSWASDCDCFSSSSVRMFAPIMLSTTPMLSVSCSRNSWWICAERLERRELDHRPHVVLEEDRQHDDVERRRLAEARRDLDVVVRAPS